MTIDGWDGDYCPDCNKDNKGMFVNQDQKALRLYHNKEPDTWFILPSGHPNKYILVHEDPFDGASIEGVFTQEQIKERFDKWGAGLMVNLNVTFK